MSKHEVVEMGGLMDGAEDWDWDDMIEDIGEPQSNEKEIPRTPARVSSQMHAILSAPEYVREPCTRCIIQTITEKLVNRRQEKHLTVVAGSSSEQKVVILKDDWVLSDVRTGDIVNVIGPFITSEASSPPTPSTATITSRANYIILHPDILFPATSISNAWQCSRRPLIASLISTKAEVTPSLVWGNMLHEVMQTCLSEGRWEKKFVEEQIDDVVKTGLHSLVKIGFGLESAKEELRTKAKGLAAFSERFVGEEPKPDAYLNDLRDTATSRSLLAITGLHDVEEDIWSPSFGLKGKIDASMQATIVEERGLKREERCWSLPFEIKTGRANTSLEHRAQTMLYTLLMAERYGVQVPSGLLYYTQSDEVIRVPASRNELRGLILRRNEMASYMARRQIRKKKDDSADVEVSVVTEGFLPPTIDDERECSRCYNREGCMLYRKAVENVEDYTSPIADLYARQTSHLTAAQCDFFKQWENLLSLEEQDTARFRKELWTMTATQREKIGRCFADMTIQEYKRVEGPNVAKIHRHNYKFTRAANSNHHTAGGSARSLLNGHIVKGDAVQVSIEPNLLALAKGFVIELEPEFVTVGVDHEINVAAILARSHGAIPGTPQADAVVFRIDKDELYSGMSRIRDNLAKLFYPDGDTKRLSLVVDLRAPQFDLSLAPAEEDLPAGMNVCQREAIKKVICAKDYALILGMPGTGKTTTIAEIIKHLVKLGKTVLLTSYTHSAVDTILAKLVDVDFEILRLGNADKIHSKARRFSLADKAPALSIEQLERQILSPPVVATTCLSIDHALFSRRTFDVCIVDEASQITLPTCLGPLRFADKFVLVGDHFQLPPLVRSKEARKGGLDNSLFRRLCEAQLQREPEAIVNLNYQYRMNEEIMLLSNQLIYSGRLKCGSQEVAQRALVLPDSTKMQKLHKGPCDDCWLERLLDPSCKAVFVDTDSVPARDSQVGDLVQNEVEATLIHQISESLLHAGVEESQIGIISLYRQQLKLLTHLFRGRRNIEMLTADRSQGRDKDCIIISMVRSNEDGYIGDLLKDWRRINVSFTRARSKLIILGSRSTLEGSRLLGDFFKLMEEKGWILRLPAGAHLMHDLSLLDNIEKVDEKKDRGKRASETADGKENVPHTPRKAKKMRMSPESVLKGRGALRDIVNDMS